MPTMKTITTELYYGYLELLETADPDEAIHLVRGNNLLMQLFTSVSRDVTHNCKLYRFPNPQTAAAWNFMSAQGPVGVVVAGYGRIVFGGEIFE